MTKEELVKLQQEVTLLRSEGKYKETIQNCYSLLNAGMEMKDYKSILTSYINLAASYYCIGDIEEAFKCIEAHEAICNIHGDDLDKLNSYNISFLIYEYNKNVDKAKATLEKSIALGKRLNKYNIVSNSYSNYSHICMIDKDYNKALKMGILGLEAAKLHEPASPILELRVKLNIAKAYIYLKDFHDSKVLLDEMLTSPFLDSFLREKSQCYDLEGQWYREQNLYRQAYESFTNAKVIVESYNDIYLLKTIQITVSIGVTDNFDSTAMHFSKLFRAADMRLYRAKRCGRNQICAVN